MTSGYVYSPSDRRKISGFTLIELLVVIVIIIILAAILFPVFISAREKARRVRCIANSKNIAIGFYLYLNDNDQKAPYIWAAGGVEDRANAIFVLTPYIGQALSRNAISGTASASQNDVDNVFQCPSAPWLRAELYTGGPTSGSTFRLRGHAWVMNETGWAPTISPWAGQGLKMGQVKRPQDLIFAAECMGFPGFGVGFGNGGIVDNGAGMVGGGSGWQSKHPTAANDPIPLSTPGVYNSRNGGSRSKIYNVRVSHDRGAMCIFYDCHVQLMKVTMHYNWSPRNWQ